MKLKILCWNINGIRSQKEDFKQFLDDLQADIICFQETKITRDQLEEYLALVDGYVSFFSFSRKRSGYSGVATYCKINATPSFAQEGLTGILNVGSLDKEGGNRACLSDSWDDKDLKDLDAEGRCIITQHKFTNENGDRKTISVLNVYCPRVDPEKPERAEFKLSFYKVMKERAHALWNSGSHVVILGDLNTAHKKIDHCDPCDGEEEFEKRYDRVFLDDFLLNTALKDNEESEECSLTDRKTRTFNESHFEDGEELKESFDNFKVVDSFRHFHSEIKEAFTCWNTMLNARSTNYGTRLDYILCDEGFLCHINDSVIHPDIHGSDHCPASIELSGMRFIPADSIPKISTKFYPEFHGSQQKLSSYFRPSYNAGIIPNTAEIDFKSESDSRSKRKREHGLSETKNKKVVSKQSTLSSFFIKNNEEVSSSPENSSSSPTTISSSSDSCEDNMKNERSNKVFNKIKEDVEEPIKSTNINKSSGWGFLMKTPAPAPLCAGHKEPAVLRTVKKKGPTLNKQFYSCARGIGKDGDPNSRCNFFKWFNHGK